MNFTWDALYPKDSFMRLLSWDETMKRSDRTHLRNLSYRCPEATEKMLSVSSFFFSVSVPPENDLWKNKMRWSSYRYHLNKPRKKSSYHFEHESSDIYHRQCCVSTFPIMEFWMPNIDKPHHIKMMEIWVRLANNKKLLSQRMSWNVSQIFWIIEFTKGWLPTKLESAQYFIYLRNTSFT